MRFKRKKSTKQRASTFHGWGRGAAHHKGSGNRGGYGRAGSGKKADGKKPSFWKEPQGKRGFTSKSRLKIRAINVDQLQNRIDEFVASGSAEKNGSSYSVDLSKAGYNKLLASGNISLKMTIKADFASKSAVEKVKSAGGNVDILKTIVKKEKKTNAPKKKQQDKEDAASE